jgi:predicted helicase
MSQVLIHKYLTELANLKKVGGTQRESVVREAFKDLLKSWGRTLDLTFIPEYELETKTRERRYVDGALLHTLRVPFGYWEAKDSHDDLDTEIGKKLRAGYPRTNIVFEDTRGAVLIQNGAEVMRCDVENVAQLEKLLRLFFGYERPEIEAFRKAVEQFKADLPAVLAALRAMIEQAERATPAFRTAAAAFLTHAQEAINPSLTDADVREMLIQHVLTGELFAAVFPGTRYHEDNSVARELHKLEATFFTGNTRHQTLAGLAPYYTAIRKAAAEIATHHQKQTFLKAIYENFYKVYNPKAADRLGVVYTPNEIVRFMIEGADWLCEKHFGRSLIDPDVDILDPATGTGTFICELIEHFAGQPAKLRHKYLHELHANEVAILPYYVANLNIEATYAAAAGRYEEFPGLCFVDTLDNNAFKERSSGQVAMFGGVSTENVARIERQNRRRISVIIGNPPYNANQLNENENNKNREYPDVDKRIKATYIAASTAQKTKLYDMYARFFRWASDRLDENGVLAFVTNRSFIDGRTFDGFRKCVAREFSEIRIVDLGGDVRANPKLSGTTHNVFGIQTGVAISFMVKRAKQKRCRIFYVRRPELETAEEKRSFLGATNVPDLAFEEVEPDSKSNWINIAENDFESLMPLATKAAKSSSRPGSERAIFKLFSLGVVTARDEWVYDEDPTCLMTKVKWLIGAYNADLRKLEAVRTSDKLAEMLDSSIKWTRAVKNDLRHGVSYSTDQGAVLSSLYRPFVKRHLYFSKRLNEMTYQLERLFPRAGATNRFIAYVAGSRLDFAVLAGDALPNYALYSLDPAQCLPLWRYVDGERVDNITDWALDEFNKRYAPTPALPRKRGRESGAERPIDTQAIFHYVYAVLHDPVYREKYALNLKREFPRIPFYADFWLWADWGRALMDLHIGYESAAPYPLTRSDVPDERSRRAGLPPKALLRANKEAGTIALDSETTLAGVPPAAWDYRLGNRSALEWVLDQYKEKTPRDPTLRERFDTYRFADYKERVVDLLARVTAVSVETVRIVEAMKAAAR